LEIVVAAQVAINFQVGAQMVMILGHLLPRNWLELM